jgi:hypothetical protein
MNTAHITFFIIALALGITIAAGVIGIALDLMAQIEQAFIIGR